MNENSTIKDLKQQAQNTKYFLDQLERAAYGMSYEELIRILGGCGKEREKEAQKP